MENHTQELNNLFVENQFNMDRSINGFNFSLEQLKIQGSYMYFTHLLRKQYIVPVVSCPSAIYSVMVQMLIQEHDIETFVRMFDKCVELRLLTVVSKIDENQAGILYDLGEFFGDGDELGRMFVNLSMTMLAIYENCSPTTIISQLILLINNSSLGENMRKHLLDKIQQLTIYENQGGDNELRDTIFEKKAYSAIGFSPLLNALWDILSCFSVSALIKGIGFEDSSIVSYVMNTMKNLCGKDMVDTLFTKIFRFAQMLCKRVVDFIKTGDISYLMGTIMAPREWLELVSTVCDNTMIRKTTPGSAKHFKEQKNKGLLHNSIVDQVDEFERLAMIVHLIDLGQVYVSSDFKRWMTEETFTLVVRQKIDKLQKEANAIRNCVSAGQYREQPFGIYMYGSAGSGKSVITEAARKEMAASQGWSTDESSAYHPVAGANFLDGLSFNHFFMILDDVDQKKEDPAYSDTTFVDLVLHFINVKPAQVEAADVESKGKIYANPKVVMMVSNYDDLDKVSRRIEDVTAFWRRFPLKVEVVVKQAYANKIGGLNIDALDNSNNYWDFRVSKYDPVNFVKNDLSLNNPHKLYEVFTSRYDFMNFLLSEFKKHRIKQAHNLISMTADRVPCEVCNISLVEHPDGLPCEKCELCGKSLLQHRGRIACARTDRVDFEEKEEIENQGKIIIDEVELILDEDTQLLYREVDGERHLIPWEKVGDKVMPRRGLQVVHILEKIAHVVSMIGAIVGLLILLTLTCIRLLEKMNRFLYPHVPDPTENQPAHPTDMVLRPPVYDGPCTLCGEYVHDLHINTLYTCGPCRIPIDTKCAEEGCNAMAVEGSNQGMCLAHHKCTCGQDISTHRNVMRCQNQVDVRIRHPMAENKFFVFLYFINVLLSMLINLLVILVSFVLMLTWIERLRCAILFYVCKKMRLVQSPATHYENQVKIIDHPGMQNPHFAKSLTIANFIAIVVQGIIMMTGVLVMWTLLWVIVDVYWVALTNRIKLAWNRDRIVNQVEVHNVYDLYSHFFGSLCISLLWLITLVYLCGFYGWLIMLSCITVSTFYLPHISTGLFTYLTGAVFLPRWITAVKHWGYTLFLKKLTGSIPINLQEMQELQGSSTEYAISIANKIQSVWEDMLKNMKNYIKKQCITYSQRVGIIALGVVAFMGAMRLLRKKGDSNQGLIHEDVNKKNLFGSMGVFVRKDVAKVPFEAKVPLNTTSVDQLVEMIKKRFWTVSRKTYASTFVMWAYNYDSNFLLLPRHFFSNEKHVVGRECKIEEKMYDLTVTNGRITYVVSAILGENLELVHGRDLAVLRVVEMFPISGVNASNHIPMYSHDPISGSILSEGYLVKPNMVNGEVIVEIFKAEGAVTYARPVGTFKAPYLTYNIPTREGWCGSILIAVSHGKVFPASMHVLMSHSGGVSKAHGEELIRSEIDVAIRNLMTANQMLVLPHAHVDSFYFDPKFRSNFEKGISPEIKVEDLPLKSSLGVAIAADLNVEVIGTLENKFPGSNMRSKCIPSLIHADMQGFHVGKLETCSPYVVPTFGGKMTETGWIDPFTYNLSGIRNVHIPPDEIKAAVVDYCTGMDGLPGWERVAPMSLHEAVEGVPGNINGINLNTSMGAPFFANKKNFIVRDKDEIKIQEILVQRIEYMIEILMSGEFLVGVAWHTMKDEVITLLKEILRKVRIFNTMPADFNILYKMFITPLENFMRQHREFFESGAGMNATSVEWEDMLNSLLKYGRDGKLGAGDYVWFDIRQATSLLDGHRMVINNMTSLASYTHMDRLMAEMLILGVMYTIRVIKNDMFLLTCTNPSGGQGTLMINGINNCLLFRIVFRRALSKSRGFSVPQLTHEILAPIVPRIPLFRSCVGLFVVGDDNIWNTNIKQEFNQLIVREELKNLGHEYTSPDKNTELEDFVSLEKATFLKRTFRNDEDLNCVLAPLDIKAVIKIAMWVKKTDLSIVDQTAVNVTNSLREMFLHGRCAFEEYKYLLNKVCIAKGIDKSSLLVLEEWEAYAEKYKSGTFITWDAVSTDFPITDLSIIENQMDNPVPLPAADNGPLTQHVLNPETISSGVVTGSIPGSRLDESGHLRDFLSRETHLLSGTFSTTDVAGTRTNILEPWTDWMQNPYVVQKTSGFAGIRGTMEIRINTSCASTMSGLYNFDAIWVDGNYHTSGGRGNLQNSTQDIHGFINCSLSNEVILTLPFISNLDYYNFIDATGYPEWTIYLNVIAPLLENLSSGVTSCTYNIYARLLPGYELVNPIVQGAHPQKISQGLSKISSGISVVGENVPFIKPLANVVSSGLAGVSYVLDMFGFTRTAHVAEPSPVSIRPFSNVCTVDGIDTSVPASMFNNNAVSIDPRIGGGVGDDPMALASLYSRQTIVAMFDWNVSAAAGSVLYTIPVTPGYGIDLGASGIQLPVCGYIGLPFTAWRGDMEYEIYIVSSSLHRGKLQVYWNHNQTAPSIDPTNQVINAIVDLDHAVSPRFRVGYMSNKPVLEMRPMSAAVIVPSACNGFLTIRVNTKLNGPSSSKATVVVMASAAENMQFGVPRTLDINGKVMEGEILYNQGQLGDGEQREVPISLVTGNPDYPVGDVMFGEQVKSVRPFMQKFSKLPTINIKVVESGTNISDDQFENSVRFSIPYYPIVPGITSSNQYPNVLTWDGTGTLTQTMGRYPFTWFAHYGSMFMGVRGGVRIKGFVAYPDVAVNGALVVSQRSSGSAIYDATSGTKTTLTHGNPALGASTPGAVAVGEQIRNGFEFNIPFYDANYKYRHAFGSTPRTSSNEAKWIDFNLSLNYLHSGATTNDYVRKVNIWQAGASDITCIRFRRVNPIILTTSGQLLAMREELVAEESTGIDSALSYQKARSLSLPPRPSSLASSRKAVPSKVEGEAR